MERGQTISGSYIAKTARSAFYNRVTREKDPSKRKSAGEGVDPAEVANQDPGPEAQALQRERRKVRHRTFEKLSPRQQQCLLLGGQGYTYREIAELVGIGEETVRTHLRDGRKRLRKLLEAEDF